MTSAHQGVDVRRRAGWLPADQEDLEAWLTDHRERVEAKGTRAPLHPALLRFRELIERDAVVRMYLERMIAEVPPGKQYRKRHLHSVDQLLRLVDAVLTMAPEFGDANVTTPLGAILDWAMGTPSGFAAFRDPRINAALRDILDAWSQFLCSPESRYVLNDSDTGWKCTAARRAIGIEQFRHDPGDEHWGFASWNDFFTRRFRDGQRPVAAPDDDKVIVSACEATPYNIATDVQRRDQFWAKNEPYSLQDMLADDDSVEQFVGGTVYQAFLSATDYHRWHSPVSGAIVRAFVQPGTYYSEADSQGADAVEPTYSQGYLAHVATRAVILIEADDPVIGLVAFVPIGMSDVSSCLLGPHVQPGAHVTKGDELGYFQFGGSTYCLIFRPGVIAYFVLAALPQPHNPDAAAVQVCTELATAHPA
ncbi:phosphatidylserine decarboxylase family protein [Pseudonocardia kujensis]|uniref:phosphatidylserine decarboxylase family protein n=1 Tax=Pseudonocardia kujensis TaxID=1128675 RepID=UPI001E3E15F5|nr:phosphatidylserine decarboxylase family protein [Pseudonocardia kujensis]MCE0767636.1 phosphatidylserine decarboxylase family protein [Pseudonocardia kujensis]